MMEDGNSAAESRHAHEQAEGEKLREMYYQAALDDLVWRIMDGQEYPRRAGRQQINLLDLLEDADDLPRIVYMGINQTVDLSDSVERIVENALRDSKWHEMRIEEMIEEEKDE